MKTLLLPLSVLVAAVSLILTADGGPGISTPFNGKRVLFIGIDGLHPEIQRLVGYLNWRTSYRQNQWYHTVEVAKLPIGALVEIEAVALV